MSQSKAKFAIGQIIHHTLFGYRGVIVDIDPYFQGSNSWYNAATRTKPPKDRPWYHVLVDGEDYTTYVAERNLEADVENEPVKHRELKKHFDQFEDGSYVVRHKIN